MTLRRRKAVPRPSPLEEMFDGINNVRITFCGDREEELNYPDVFNHMKAIPEGLANETTFIPWSAIRTAKVSKPKPKPDFPDF